jgi:hypothetical protein
MDTMRRLLVALLAGSLLSAMTGCHIAGVCDCTNVVTLGCGGYGGGCGCGGHPDGATAAAAEFATPPAPMPAAGAAPAPLQVMPHLSEPTPAH